MQYVMSADYFAQRLQCPRDSKRESLEMARQLMELAFAARQDGLLKMDEMISDQARYPDPFLRKAVSLVVEFSNLDNVRDVLYNYICSTKHIANNQFLNQVMITETILAIGRSESLEYIFNYLVPSLFGIEYDTMVVEAYRDFKKQLLNERTSGL